MTALALVTGRTRLRVESSLFDQMLGVAASAAQPSNRQVADRASSLPGSAAPSRRRGLPGRRVTLLQLASEVPAAVLAELLHLTPGTATRWTRDAGGDWSRYAADLARRNDYQP